jgi:hypothetical protein
LPHRWPKISLIPALVIAVGLAGVAGAAVLTRSPHHLTKISVSPKTTTSPAAGKPGEAAATPGPNQPAVAGVSTEIAAPKTSVAQKVASKIAAAAGKSAPTPVPTASANVAVLLPGNVKKFIIKLPANPDACNVLDEALAEGKISSLTIDRSEHNMDNYHSAMVTQIENYTGAGWNYTVTDQTGKPLPPSQTTGCSLTPVKAGYTITWKPA